jgi:hypothetical protein
VPNDFVVFCEARTGSYSLVSRLSSCPDVICHGEIFKRARIEVPRFHLGRLERRTIQARNAEPMEFIAELRAINRFKHFGFKLFNHHLAWAPETVAYLTSSQVKKVVLYRDPREVYASSLRARTTGVWTLPQGRQPRRKLDVKVSYAPESFEAFLRHYNAFTVTARLVAAQPNSFVLHYDQINDLDALQALLDFLGSKTRASDSSTDFEKQFKGRLEDGFENWDAFAERLAQNPRPLPGPTPSHRGPVGPEEDRAPLLLHSGD